MASSFLPPREAAVALRWTRTDADAEPWDALDRARKEARVNLRACYCSVLNECWVAETGKFPPRSVSSCAPASEK